MTVTQKQAGGVFHRYFLVYNLILADCENKNQLQKEIQGTIALFVEDYKNRFYTSGPSCSKRR